MENRGWGGEEENELEVTFSKFSSEGRKPTIPSQTPPCSKAAHSIVTKGPYTRTGPIGSE